MNTKTVKIEMSARTETIYGRPRSVRACIDVGDLRGDYVAPSEAKALQGAARSLSEALPYALIAPKVMVGAVTGRAYVLTSHGPECHYIQIVGPDGDNRGGTSFGRKTRREAEGYLREYRDSCEGAHEG